MKNLRSVRLPTAAFSVLLPAIALMAAGVPGFGAARALGAQTAKTRPPGMNSSISLTLGKSAQKRAGVVTAPLAHVFRTRKIRAYGMVLSLGGLASLGQSYARAAAQVENAKTKLRVSQIEYARQKTLYAQNQSSSLKSLQRAQSLWDQDRVNLRSALAVRQAISGEALQRWGRVISQWTFDGSPSYSKLLDREEALVQITVPPGEKIAPMPPEITIQSAAPGRLEAHFVSPAPRTDPLIQGVSYFYLVSNRSGQVQDGMNVTAFLPQGPKTGGFVVPSSAVVWQNGQPLVFVQTGGKHFTARPVATNFPISGGYLVTSGFSPRDHVVVKGAQALLSQALLFGPKGVGVAQGDDD